MSILAMSSSALRTFSPDGNSSWAVSTSSSAYRKQRQHQRIVDDLDRCKMLRLADDDLGDADAPGFLERIAKQRVRVTRSLLGRQVVRRLEIAIVDLVGLDEVKDVDRAIFTERGRLQVFFCENDEMPLFVLEAFDEVFPRDRFTFALADALVAHRRLVPRMQHAELRPVIADRRVQLDGNGDKAERYGAFPD